MLHTCTGWIILIYQRTHLIIIFTNTAIFTYSYLHVCLPNAAAHYYLLLIINWWLLLQEMGKVVDESYGGIASMVRVTFNCKACDFTTISSKEMRKHLPSHHVCFSVFSCIFIYFSLRPSIIGHVNIGITCICSFLLEIPNDASLSQFWLAVQHSRQEYCKLIGWYWKIMRRQLWTLACPIVYLAGRFVVVRFWVRTKFFMMRVAWPPVPLSSPVISSCACIHTQIHAVWGWPYHQICPS